MLKHEQWFSLAEIDLSSARLLTEASLITALFHIQQCAEKALKGFLVYRERSIVKTHDLVQLVDQCTLLDVHFETLRFIAVTLNPYQVAGRYPDMSFDMPTPERMHNGIVQAEYLLSFVLFRTRSRTSN